ncbi:hypothetical protein BGZ83_004664 [Gryganskiella cystojenkinii]|nr:hypothetical protein BGZ83_004664 [Gryganskiella cystojenkinii]
MFRKSISGRPASNIPRPNPSSGGAGMNGPPGNGAMSSGASSNSSSGINSISMSNVNKPTNSNIPKANSNNGPNNNNNNNNANHGRYLFPMLRPNQLLQCMADLKLNFTEEDLAKTTPQKMMEVCDTFMDVAQGYIKDVVMLEDIQELTSTQSPEFVFEAVRFYVFLTQL